MFEKHVTDKHVDHLEKCGLFSDFQYNFRSTWSTANPLKVVFERIARTFDRSRATWAVAFDKAKAFGKFWHAVLVRKRKSYGISGQMFALISPFLNNRQPWVVLDDKSSQKIQLMLEFLEALFLVLYFSCYTLTTFLVLSVILPMLMILLSTLSLIRVLSCGNN